MMLLTVASLMLISCLQSAQSVLNKQHQNQIEGHLQTNVLAQTENTATNIDVQNKLAEIMMNMKIRMPDKCAVGGEESRYKAKKGGPPGNQNFYQFQVPTPRPKEVRIAFLGDSTTQGCCEPSKEVLSQVPAATIFTDQTDGTELGSRGYPYHLHELLRNNNQSIQYTFMNQGKGASNIMPNHTYSRLFVSSKWEFDYDYFYQAHCEFEKAMRSLPHFVFINFGNNDSYLANFLRDLWVENYVKLVKEVQSIPSKPMVFLMVSGSDCSTQLPQYQDNPELSAKGCAYKKGESMAADVKKVAAQTGIPEHHIVDGYAIIRAPNRKESALNDDGTHPNERGYSELAQEFYMKMASSPEYMERQSKILKMQDEDWNKAVEQAALQQ